MVVLGGFVPTTFVLRYDFRTPGASRAERQEVYARALEQARFAEAHGAMAVMVSEHHVAGDGFLPSPVPVAAALAAATTTLPVAVSALLVNLYDPVRLAEDLAVVDHLSGGRVSYTVGLGYRAEEYAHFGRSWERRGAEMEERLGILLGLLRGEEVEVEGRRVRLDPLPCSDPHPMIFYGGGTPVAARRAARLGLGFAPQQPDRELKELYRATCRELGRDPGFVMMPPPGPAYVFCAEDPDRFWAEHGHHLLADAQGYARWGGAQQHFVRDDSATVEELRAAGRYLVGSPDELVARARDGRLPLITAHAACGGLPAEASWESLRLIGERVLPGAHSAQAGSQPSTSSAPREAGPA